MDPNANARERLELLCAKRWDADDADRYAELRTAYREWRVGGGFAADHSLLAELRAAERSCRHLDPLRLADNGPSCEPVPPVITSVWSAYGHSFIEHGDYESCMVCGALYELVAIDGDNPTVGRYQARNGDEPHPCTRNTAMVHDPDASNPTTCNCIACST